MFPCLDVNPHRRSDLLHFPLTFPLVSPWQTVSLIWKPSESKVEEVIIEIYRAKESAQKCIEICRSASTDPYV